MYDMRIVSRAADALARFFDEDGVLLDRAGFEAEFQRHVAAGLKYPRDVADALVDAGMDPEVAAAVAFDGLSALEVA